METTEKKIKSYLVELKHPDRQVTQPDGGKKTVEGETSKYWYVPGEFPKEILDRGCYWDFSCDSWLYPTDEAGIEVVSDLGMLNDRLDQTSMKVGPLIDDPLLVKNGDWVEIEDDGKKLRVTAFESLPPLSAKQTLANSDLDIRAMARIRINGKPLYEAGTMENGTVAWLPDLRDVIVGTVVKAFRERGGATAEISYDGDILQVSKGETSLPFRLKAKSREGVIEFLRNIGVKNPETVKVEKTEGDENGVTGVHARVVLDDNLD